MHVAVFCWSLERKKCYIVLKDLLQHSEERAMDACGYAVSLNLNINQVFVIASRI
jgi:hypothetical protein